MARVFISHSSRDNAASQRIKDWLAEQGFETPFLDFDKHSGIPPGSDWEHVLYREIDKSEAMIIVQTPNWLDSKWCFAEFTQARALGKPIFPVIIDPSSGDQLISSDIQALDLTKDSEGGLAQLGTELTRIALDAQGGFDWDRTRAPFPGLLAFQEEDAAIYFGRDDDIRRLIERLNARAAQGGAKLIALLGASGSGKSSLMRAGVIPRLKRSGKSWIVLPTLRPERRPFDQFARTLAIAIGRGEDWREIRARLETDAEAELADLAADLRIKAEANEAKILIPVDQAEELFGASDRDQARLFNRALSAALGEGLPFLALFAMRSDFLGGLQAAPGLTARFEEFSLGPMPLVRIPQIIEGPARVVGLGVEDAFVQQAARDAETEDALPLLAFALRKLYDTASDDNYLSHEEYMALGDPVLKLSPLENAVRRAADKVLEEMAPSPEDLTALRDAFVPDLVRINDQGEYVRQPARWDALPARAHPLIERLANDRLLILRQEDGVRIVDVAHEALLRKWPRLRGWLDEAREFLTGRQQMEQDRYDWEHAPDAQKDAALLTGLKLNRARSWLTERPQQLSEAERGYIQRSIDAHEAEQRRHARNRKLVLAGSVAASIALAGFGGYSFYQNQRAQEALAQVEQATITRAQEQVDFVWNSLATQVNVDDHLRDLARQFGAFEYRTRIDRYSEKDDGFVCDPTGLGDTSSVRYHYCTIRDVITYQALENIVGTPIYRSGPHKGELNLTNTKSFGYYNPDFIDWVGTHLVNAEKMNPETNPGLWAVWNGRIGSMVRALYRSHRILHATPEERQAIQADYNDLIAQFRDGRRTLGTTWILESSARDKQTIGQYETSYRNRLKSEGGITEFGQDFHWLGAYLDHKFGPLEDGDGNGGGGVYYNSIEAAQFWVRRRIDGTDSQVFDLVTQMLAVFEPEVLNERW